MVAWTAEGKQEDEGSRGEKMRVGSNEGEEKGITLYKRRGGATAFAGGWHSQKAK